MWNNSGAAAGYRDPTTLFNASSSSSSSSSLSSASESDEDYRTLHNLFEAAPSFYATSTSPPSQQQAQQQASAAHASRWDWLLPRRAHTRVELSPEALKARRRQQRERQEHFFFKERGALDFQRSAVFDAGRSDEHAERSLPPSSSFSRASPAEAESVSRFSHGAMTGHAKSCVPTELQAWYVASSVSPSTSPRRAPTQPQRQHTSHRPAHTSRETRAKREETEAAATRARQAASEEEGNEENTQHERLKVVSSNSHAVEVEVEEEEEEDGEGGGVLASVFAPWSSAVSPVQGSGAGTASVNMLWSRPAPSAAARHARPASPSVATQNTRQQSQGNADKRGKKLKKQKNRGRAQQAEAGNAGPTSQNPLKTARRADGAALVTTAAAAATTTSSLPSSSPASSVGGDGDGGIRGDNNNNNINRLHSNTHTLFDDEAGSDSTRSGESDAAAHKHAAQDGFAPARARFDVADGGRPPLRAHRYVEQPNGVFIDHARHAELLAHCALEEQVRYAQEREDAHRARRWNRLLHGSSRSTTNNKIDNKSGGAPSTGRRDSMQGQRAAIPTRYNWLYDAATYRARYLAVLRYLQRVHVFLVAVAAGVSLLTLIAFTVPFPALSLGEAEDGRPNGTQAVLLLAMLNTTASASSGNIPSAQVLPIAQQGHTALALVVALLQPYHASLFLFLCIVLVISGFAPVSWGVAERYWMAQRRHWLEADEQQRREAGGRPGATNAAHAAASGSSGAGAYYTSYGQHHSVSPSLNGDDDTFEMSGSVATNTMRSPFAHTLTSTAFAAHHRSTMGYGAGGGMDGRDDHGLSRSPFPSFPDDRHARGLAASMRASRGGRQQQQRRFPSPSSVFHSGSSPVDPRLGMSVNEATLPSPLRGAHDALGSSRYAATDPLRGSSMSFGMTRGVSMADLGYRHADAHELTTNNGGGGGGGHDWASGSLGDWPTTSNLSRDGPRGVHPSLYVAGTMLARGGLSGSPTASFNDTSLLQLPMPMQLSYHRAGPLGPYHQHPGLHSNPHPYPGAAAWRGGGGTSSISDRVDGARRVGSSRVDLSQLFLPAPVLLLPTTTTLEGRLSADNFLSRTFDYVERRVAQWMCNTLAQFFSREDDEDDKNDNDAHRNGKKTRRHHLRYATGQAALTRRLAVPASLYLHLVLQPRLWCVVIALALTVVELACVDERSVALLWLAQPTTWWSASSSSSSSSISTQARSSLPHTWLSAAFTDTTSGLVGTAVAASAAATGYGSPTGVDGHVGRILLGVYAARTAVIWLAFILNLFF